MNTNLSKRQLMLAGAGLMTSQLAAAFPVCTQARNQICNVTKLYSVTAGDIVVARDVDDIRRILKSDAKQISIGGGRYSMGGQTAISQGVQIDMRSFKQLVWIKPMERIVRVQAGMRWRDLQTILDPLDLSVQTMQSYANFTVGGAVSVNCHGRYIGHGAIVHSVRSLQLVLPSGEAIEVNRQSNAELFYAAIGGYGAVGIVTEIELNMDANFKIERSTGRVPLLEYPEWFHSQIQANKDVLLHNAELFYAAIGGYGAVGIVTEIELNMDANFKIERSTGRVPLLEYPEWFHSQIQANKDVLLHNADLTPPTFDTPFCVTWTKTAKPVTTVQRLTPEGQTYKKEQLAIWAMTELPKGEKLRASVQKTQHKNEVVWRNHEASLDVAELEPASRQVATYVLQEYFVPVSQFKAYVQDLAKLMRSMATQTVNISIRHSKADAQTLMSWAKEDVFCFVVFYKQRMQVQAEVDVGRWTRAMIDLALKHKGRYYLPYQPHATQTQFEQAYPEAEGLRRLRKEIGAMRLSNMMWDRHKV